MARWSGWGALPGIFDHDDARWAAEREELSSLLDDKQWIDARGTVINAHYTDPEVVAAIWEAAQALGFDGGRVLEPGCGSGNFMAYAPEGVDLVGVERDRPTAAIAQALYPDADIHADPFERFDAHSPFDLAVGNVPFARDVVSHDRRYNRGRHTIHNYFLIKSLRLLRPGGLLLALSSRYTMDARNPAARRELAQHGDLIGAVRLPERAMARIAGTDAMMDLLILRRREPGAEPAGQRWDRTTEIVVPDETNGGETTAEVNTYFADNPDHMLGRAAVGHAMYAVDFVLRQDGNEVGQQVSAALASITAHSSLRYSPPDQPGHPLGNLPKVRKVGDTELAGDRLPPMRNSSFATSRTGVIYQHRHGELLRADVPRNAVPEVQHLIELRDLTVNLLRLEADDAPEPEIQTTRERLAEHYRKYQQWWGPLNRVSWRATGRTDPETGEPRRARVPARLGGFRADPEWPTLSAIEIYDEDTGVANPAAIQRHRVIFPPPPILGADTPQEALAISLDETGKVDLERIAELLGIDQGAAAAELEEFVFTKPVTRELVPAEEYLSGDVRQKLLEAETAAGQNESFSRNVAALAAVQPGQISPGDITVKLGVPWVQVRDIERFTGEALEIHGPRVQYKAALGLWEVKGDAAIGSKWSGGGLSQTDLLEACLNQRLVRITRTDGKKRVTDVSSTAAARERQEQISERFSRWVWEDPERASRIADRYNELFNSYVPPEYRGDHLTFPGLADGFVPHEHQRSAVARILREGRVLLGHAVGAGKTATMVMAGMELRRLGTINLPCYAVPNHMLEQFSRELLQLYPQARVLVATKEITGKAGRKEFVARAATGDWDAVVITHSAFECLPLRQENYEAYVDERCQALEEALTAAEDEDDRRTVKQVQRAIEGIKARYESLVDAGSKDDGVCLEETGIDMLFLDELHLFKNKGIVTAVEGVSTAGSRRSMDLDSKLWYLHQKQGKRCFVGATATPIANTIAEAWTMQTYVQPDLLEDSGLDRFDNWAATFAQQVSAVEMAPDGGSYRVTTRLARYQNVPELVSQFRRTADIRGREDLDLKLPSLRGGGPTVVTVPPSDALVDFVHELVWRAERIRKGQVKPHVDNMLAVTGDGRRAALDLRLVGLPPDPEGGKLATATDRIARIYNQTKQKEYLDDAGNPSPTEGGFQIVFCDLATPKDDGAWSAYDELKTMLTERGIPRGEIAFIHDARSDDARAQLFTKCRNGQIAVLLGSTEKMGVGTNIHTRAVALHHIDAPWRPADIEQREGRVIRQGNQNDEVQIFRYATEGSFDVYMWQTLERKARFISQVMRNDAVARDVDDVDDSVLSFAEVKALASGNPLILEQAGVQSDLAKHERLQFAHDDEQRRMATDAERHRAGATAAQKRVEAIEHAIAWRQDTSGDKFTMEIEGKRYDQRPKAAADLRAKAEDVFAGLANTLGSDWKVEHGEIGELGGFPISLRGHRIDATREAVFRVEIPNLRPEREARITADELADNANIVQRLEALLRKLDRDLKTEQEQAEERATKASALEERIGEPFEHTEKLAALRKRNQEIQAVLRSQAADDEARDQYPGASPPGGYSGPSTPDDSAHTPGDRLNDLVRGAKASEAEPGSAGPEL